MRFAFIHCPAGDLWNKSAKRGKERRNVARRTAVPEFERPEFDPVDRI